MSLIIKLVALVVHEVREELRRLEPVERDQLQYDPRSTTSGEYERAQGWDHDRRNPIGFRSGG